MLYEITKVKSYENEPGRRWFFDHEIDLTVWFGENETIVGFQLCYDKPEDPHALTWWENRGFQHHKIDDGECFGTSAHKGIPILEMDGAFDKDRIAAGFFEKSREMDSAIADFVYDRIMQYSCGRAAV